MTCSSIRISRMLAAAAGSLLPFVSAPELHAAPIIRAGAGSYSTVVPEGCKPLPKRIFKSDAVEGPTLTHQWWSSLVWQEFSNNMFPHPLAMVCLPEGLAVTYPGAALVASPDAIMGGGVTESGDFQIGLSNGKPFDVAECDGYSDWFVTAAFRSGDATLRTSFGHGSPFIFGSVEGGRPVIRFAERPRIWVGTPDDAVLGVTVRGNHYGLFGPTGSRWAGADGTTWTNESDGKNYFSVALLPDDKPGTLRLFRGLAHNHVVGTRMEHEVRGGMVTTRYSFETRAMESGEGGTVFALYPHQWKYTSLDLTGMKYNSVRGEMKVGTGIGFTTAVPVHGVLPVLPKEGITDRGRILASLKREAVKKPDGFLDTYWEGKHLGRLATLAGVADTLGESGLRDELLGEIKRRLENWFTASPGEVAPLFYYDSNWGSLVGSKASFGSDMPLNDHHFHYGYFIRAAAEVARFDSAWAEKWKAMVMLLIRDIASPDRKDPMFPFIRCFDKYAGHSWASGDANFADGNNQESSSESLNAWYGVMLWGEATGDAALRDLGTSLFNIERTAVEEYWFDVSGTNFPKTFPEVALGMVWGGKGAFATWFSGDVDCIHGINWLPFTPASLYMGRHPDYVRKNFERIVQKREKGSDFNNGWGDLVVMFGALSRPAEGIAYFQDNPSCSLEGGNTHTFMDQWLGTLDSLGTIDASVTADHPFHSVFVKDGVRSHAAYNHGSSPLEVSFSDGTKLVVAPRSLAVRSAGGSP